MSKLPNWLKHALLAGHRGLLRAYPRSFSETFTDEMQGVFASALDQAAHDGPWPIAALIVREWVQAPALVVAEHWRTRHAGGRIGLVPNGGHAQEQVTMRRPLRVFAGFGLMLLAFWLWLLAVMGWRADSGLLLPSVLAVTPLAGLLAWAAIPLARRLPARVWIVTGLLCLFGLAWPTSLLVEYVLDGWPPPIRALVFGLPSVALIVTGWLLAAGLSHWGQGRRGWTPAACLAVGTALTAKTLHSLYWLLVWDTTYDALGFLWLIPPALAAVFAAVVLFGSLAGRAKWAGLYGVLLLALLGITASRAQSVSFHELTAARAAQVAQALAAFHEREGRYPEALGQLVPWYRLVVPGPVIINGQTWCYQGGEDFFRLGYVDREHWSSPNLYGTLYAANGHPAALPALCAAELAALQAPRAAFGWP